jgi:hypothetical protein
MELLAIPIAIAFVFVPLLWLFDCLTLFQLSDKTRKLYTWLLIPSIDMFHVDDDISIEKEIKWIGL